MRGRTGDTIAGFFRWLGRRRGRSVQVVCCDAWAMRSRLEPMNAFARMVKAHLPGILAWTRLRIRNGALEGMNNKVKVIAHRAYGFRKAETYITAVYHCCADLPL